MPDVLPIRANEEIQARFRDFAAAGDFRTHTEFLNHLLTLYAAQETAVRVPTLETAISAVNELTDRINKVLIGAGETISVNQEKEKAQMEAIKQEAEKKVNTLNTENESLKTAFEEQMCILENTKKVLIESQEHEKKLDQILDDKTALIDGYREKIDGLEIEINRQKILVTEAMDAMAELDALRLKSKEQDLQIEHMFLEKDKALNDQKVLYMEKSLEKDKALNDQKAFYTEKMAAAASDYESTIRQREFEIGQVKNLNDKALIELEAKLRKEMNDQQIQYGRSISDYESRVFALLKEFENLKIRETKIPNVK